MSPKKLKTGKWSVYHKGKKRCSRMNLFVLNCLVPFACLEKTAVKSTCSENLSNKQILIPQGNKYWLRLHTSNRREKAILNLHSGLWGSSSSRPQMWCFSRKQAARGVRKESQNNHYKWKIWAENNTATIATSRRESAGCVRGDTVNHVKRCLQDQTNCS